MKIKLSEKARRKIAALELFLIEKHSTELSRLLSIKKEKLERIIKGEEDPSMRLISLIALYFTLTPEDITDDGKELPQVPVLKEELRKSKEKKEKGSKLFFSYNWSLLSERKRKSLVISTFLIIIPLVVYMVYCIATVTGEKIEKISSYRTGSDESEIYDQYDAEQCEYHSILEETDKKNKEDAYYATVKVGTVLEKIKNIDSSSSSYEARMQVYFKFDKDEFRSMFRHYARTVLADQIIDDYYLDNPDYPQPGDIVFSSWLDEHNSYFESWVEKHDSEYYPGETASNVLTDKNTMFDIGNGTFVADSYGTIKELEEIQYYDEDGVLRTLCYQKVKFTGLFEKSFDSSRYPLDSIQFKMYITPTMDANYIRYVPDRDSNSLGRLSGFSPYFSVAGGYRLMKESDGIKNFIQRINYSLSTNNDPAIPYDSTIKTQLEITVRANRQGISLFLKAFINLFSVVIWVIIAFYNQTYEAGEDSIGMLGTGLFGVISSMLVGLSMVSDAGIFSLTTMINIFTLAVIMIMTYQAIASKRARMKKDSVLIAYNAIKVRVLFYALTTATAVMFFILPCISYMWGL